MGQRGALGLRRKEGLTQQHGMCGTGRGWGWQGMGQEEGMLLGGDEADAQLSHKMPPFCSGPGLRSGTTVA